MSASLAAPASRPCRPEQQPARRPPPAWLVVSAFVTVYLVWGSTYLGMHVAIQTIPPFLMAGARFLCAGSALHLIVRLTGAPRAEAIHWRSALITSAFLLVIGNGVLCWVQQFAPTNLTAIMVAATPLWMSLIDWLRPGGRRPGALVVAGLVLGFAGVALMVLSRTPGGERVLQPMVAVILLITPLGWAFGSIRARHAPQTAYPLLNISLQMLCAGAMMIGISLLIGETHGFHLAQVSRASALAFVYLSAIGSLLAFTAYAWLLQVSTPARVSTYAYVNPLIAVVLGWLVLNEPLPAGIILAGSLILLSVVMLTLRRS